MTYRTHSSDLLLQCSRQSKVRFGGHILRQVSIIMALVTLAAKLSFGEHRSALWGSLALWGNRTDQRDAMSVAMNVDK